MKRFILNLVCICFLLILVLETKSSIIYADTISEIDNYDITTSYSPRQAETGYVYKIVDGVLKCRLWSYTEGIWLEDEWHDA